mmetsp:Transcript_59875/g.129806  ORF Transcript_59875/g.129806 Transcript_59875/m.129806 type:complete len:323 (+) Transcript_59875:642-1610(+)
MGATLEPWEDCGVDLLLEVVLDGLALLVCGTHTLPEEDHGAARSSERLVRSGGDHVSELERRGDDAGNDESGDMRHVRHEVGATLVGDLPHARVINKARVSACARDKDLGSDAQGEFLALVVVDEASLLVQAVGDGLEVLGDHGDLLRIRLVAVRQVAAVGEVQAHDAVVHVAQRGVDLEVGRRSAQGLHVNPPVLGVKPARLQCPPLAKRFSLIDKLVASVVACAGVALGVLVHHDGAHRLEHALRGEVLRGDQVDTSSLPVLLPIDDGLHLRIQILQRDVQPLCLHGNSPDPRRRCRPSGAGSKAGASALHCHLWPSSAA